MPQLHINYTLGHGQGHAPFGRIVTHPYTGKFLITFADEHACSTGPMSSGEAVIWLVASVAVLTLALYVLQVLRRAAERRARRRRYQRLGHESAPARLQTQPGALSGSMGPDRAAAIRRDAENAARLVASGLATEAKNPHRDGSPEFVLWVATYHLTMTELAEEAQGEDGAAWQPAPAAPEGKISPP